MSDSERPLTYNSYLLVDQLLGCQRPQSQLAGQPAHDEMLFIVVHQICELWFKQILCELDRVRRVFLQPKDGWPDLAIAIDGLDRIQKIQRVLQQQFEVLETMTPLGFLAFRDRLGSSSGFQSLQFRLIEIRLGLRRDQRLGPAACPFDQDLSEADKALLARAEREPALIDLLEAWLESSPYLDYVGPPGEAAFTFKQSYRLASTGDAFDSLFDENRHGELQAKGAWKLSAPALQTALFIMLYQQEPALRLSYQLLDRLMEMDIGWTAWRQRHALMVQRMIGRKIGTGGTTGDDYLKRASEHHRVFADLFTLATYLVPPSRVPPLPPSLQAALRSPQMTPVPRQRQA